jgi:hypothetical protein
MLGMVRGRLKVSLLEYLEFYDWCACLSEPSPSQYDSHYLFEDFDRWFEEESGFPMFHCPSHVKKVVFTKVNF